MAQQWMVLPVDPDLDPDPYLEDVHVPALPRLQHHVGGYVEVVLLDLPGGRVDLWCNEEGAYSGLPVNLLATLLAKTFSDVLLMPEGIRGGAVLAASGRMGETTGLPQPTIDRLTALFTALHRKVTP